MNLYVWELQNGMVCVMASSIEEAFATAKEQLPDYEFEYLDGKYQIYNTAKALAFWSTG